MRQGILGEDITIYGDGSQTRSFQFVSDLVDGLWLLLMSDEVMPVNIGNPVEISIKHLAEEILQLTGNKSTITYQPLPAGFEDDPKIRQPDTTRARTLLGWEPRVDRLDGLRATAERLQGAARAVVDCTDQCEALTVASYWESRCPLLFAAAVATD